MARIRARGAGSVPAPRTTEEAAVAAASLARQAEADRVMAQLLKRNANEDAEDLGAPRSPVKGGSPRPSGSPHAVTSSPVPTPSPRPASARPEHDANGNEPPLSASTTQLIADTFRAEMAAVVQAEREAAAAKGRRRGRKRSQLGHVSKAVHATTTMQAAARHGDQDDAMSGSGSENTSSKVSLESVSKGAVALTQVSSGRAHTMAVSAKYVFRAACHVHVSSIVFTVACCRGTLFAWGCSDDGQLGLGDYDEHRVPVRVSSLATILVATIACGHDHSVSYDFNARHGYLAES